MCRLQYFARGVQGYIKQLRLALQGKVGESLITEEVNSVFNLIFIILMLKTFRSSSQMQKKVPIII